jgi:hypothetical protein
VLHGFLYSLRNKKERKYELLDVAFASQLKRLDKGRLWPGFPHVYFSIEMLLHAQFHLAPVNSNTKRREEWFVLDKTTTRQLRRQRAPRASRLRRDIFRHGHGAIRAVCKKPKSAIYMRF